MFVADVLWTFFRVAARRSSELYQIGVLPAGRADRRSSAWSGSAKPFQFGQNLKRD
jgi:hypothetical protein